MTTNAWVGDVAALKHYQRFNNGRPLRLMIDTDTVDLLEAVLAEGKPSIWRGIKSRSPEKKSKCEDLVVTALVKGSKLKKVVFVDGPLSYEVLKTFKIRLRELHLVNMHWTRTSFSLLFSNLKECIKLVSLEVASRCPSLVPYGGWCVVEEALPQKLNLLLLDGGDTLPASSYQFLRSCYVSRGLLAAKRFRRLRLPFIGGRTARASGAKELHKMYSIVGERCKWATLYNRILHWRLSKQ